MEHVKRVWQLMEQVALHLAANFAIYAGQELCLVPAFFIFQNQLHSYKSFVYNAHWILGT